MMTLIGKLCAICALSALIQTALPGRGQGSLKMIGGLLMLHLVLSGVQDIVQNLLKAGSLTCMFEILAK